MVDFESFYSRISNLNLESENTVDRSEKPKFEVKIIRSFTSCLVRQLWEAIRIRRRLQEEARGEVRLLNSRSEYSRCSLPRLIVEDSYEKTVSDTDTEKEEERIPKEHANEREPAVVELNSNKK